MWLHRHPQRVLRYLFFVLFLGQPALAGVNFDQCWNATISGPNVTGGTDNHGNPVPIANATAFTYGLCVQQCGSASQDFDWNDFSQQFGAWLLPYLALVSQLPFGAQHRLGNVTSVFLAVGSPALAGYSLALTVLNGRWVAHKFSRIRYPNARHAAKVLGSLQQAPLRLTSHEDLLASLIVLPENDVWWRELADALDYTNTWSIAALTQIAWVIIAYVLTVVQSLSDVNNNVNSNGQGVGSVWLWLIPIVGGWLQLSPKCDTARLRKAFKKTKAMPFVASEAGPAVHVAELTEERALSIDAHAHEGEADETMLRDEELSAPIFNYARFLPWVQCVEEIVGRFEAAAKRAHMHDPVDCNRNWVSTLHVEDVAHRETSIGVRSENRRGTVDQVVAYARRRPSPHGSYWGSGVFTRMFIAAACGLALLWGTTGSAVVVVWFTPTIGLSCRSTAYLVYGILGTIVMFLMIASTVLAHYANPQSHLTNRPMSGAAERRIAAALAVAARRTGKLLAVANAVGIVCTCIFQFANVFNNCTCNSNFIGFRYAVMENTAADLKVMADAWGAALALASLCCIGFWCFIILIKDPEDDAWFGV